MSLRGQDVLVALKLALASEELTYAQLGTALGISLSQAFNAMNRAVASGLVVGEPKRVNKAGLIEFLVHGIKYVFPAVRGAVQRGIPTAYSAPPLNAVLAEGDTPLVWAHPEGTTRGETLEPVYKTAPDAALADSRLYAALALIDAIRAGRARERELAADHLVRLLRDG